MKRFLVSAFLFVLAAAPLLAHGKGRLKLGSQRLTPGGAVELTGEEFDKNETLTILLVGASARVAIGTVRSDASGKFAKTVTLPADLAPGSYRLVLEAPDKDELATADVHVATAGAQMAEEHHHADPAEHGEHMPSAAPLELARARSPLVTGGAVAAIVAALAVGAMLLKRNGA